MTAALLLALALAIPGAPAVPAASPPPVIPPPPTAPVVPGAAATHFDVSLAQGRATVGDRIEVLLTLRAPAAELAGEPRFPAWTDSWGEAEVLEKGPPTRISVAGGIAVYRQRLVVTAWHPGQVPLPPVAVAVPLRAATIQAAGPANLALSLSSVLPPKKEGEKDPTPKPAAPPRPLPLGAAFAWTTAALAAACLGAGALLWRRGRERVETRPAVPALAPLPEFLAEIAGLDGLAGEGSAVRVHTRLSLALRHYLARSLLFPAEESTTSEVHRQLLAHQLPSPLVRRIVELLRSSDLVKFARQEVGEERSRERLEAARAIGQDLETYLKPPPLTLPEPLEKAG
jgi:hypothetical protein